MCVTNRGRAPTQGLTIRDYVEIRTSARGEEQVYATADIDVGDKPVLEPGEQHCYAYDIPFAKPVGTQKFYYRNRAHVTITNYPSHAGTPFGPEPTAQFQSPASPTVNVVRDDEAWLDDALICPPGFRCETAQQFPVPFSDGGSLHYSVDVSNDSASCGNLYALRNDARLTEHDSYTVRKDYAEASIYTGDCPPVVQGCTQTQGYWKNHPEDWSGSSLSLGKMEYTQEQLLSILDAPVEGNGLISLAHQLIAARLNSEVNGASVPMSVATAISAADGLIDGQIVPPVGNGFLAPSDTSDLTAILDAYNNGQAVEGPPHCD